MTGLLAHNQSLAHHPTRIRTFYVHSHIMTRPLAHFDSHITALAHYDRTVLAHYRTRTRSFHIHSHIMTGPLAHFIFTRTL